MIPRLRFRERVYHFVDSLNAPFGIEDAQIDHAASAILREHFELRARRRARPQAANIVREFNQADMQNIGRLGPDCVRMIPRQDRDNFFG